jgi:hypothetical protein
MASFRTHFTLKDEEVLASPAEYERFWSDASQAMTSSSQSYDSVLFLHKADELDGLSSRFRSVNTDSLPRPLHVLQFKLHPTDEAVKHAWHQTQQAYPDRSVQLKYIDLIEDSVTVRLFNNSVALLQVDLNIKEFVREEQLNSDVDWLQELGVFFGENLARSVYHKRIHDYLTTLLKKCPNGKQYIDEEQFNFDSAMANAVLIANSTPTNQNVRVNWVTRTLLIESANEPYREHIIEHWLKDCGDPELIKETKSLPDAYAIRWLNYVFREDAYNWALTAEGTIDYAQPFSDEWQAMLNAQYYYAAFEALNDALISTLARSYRHQKASTIANADDLKKLGRQLERYTVTANLATLEYHNNFGYYKRNIGSTMKKIMAGWDFNEAILNEVKRKTDLCEQRINDLHKKAESRSGFYSDLLLLGIALISVSAFLFQIIEYGRNMSHNVDLAVYESNTWNLVKFISERPTDFIITLSFALIVVLFVLYAWFRRLKVMD